VDPKPSAAVTVGAAGPRPALAADLASLAVCSLIWGTTWYAITLQVGAVPAAQSVALRFGLASILLFGWCVLRGRAIALDRRQHLAVLLQGVSSFALSYTCVYKAEEHVASGAMAVIFAATAFVNLILFRLILRQMARPIAWAGTLLGLVGVGFMSWSQLGAASSGFGVALAFAGVLAAALGNLFAARAQALGVAVAAGTAWAMGYGAALVAAVSLLTGVRWTAQLSAVYLGGLAYLSLFGSVVAFVVYYGLARRRGYTFATYIAALTPPTAMLVSAVFEHTRWGPSALVGVLLVLAGQGLLLRASRG
jgi:drug/metabolite transporter (DMT)-like permease